MQNFFIYLAFVLFIAGAVLVISRRNRPEMARYRVFVLLTLPAFFLVLTGIAVGIRQVPREKVMIHGYRTALKNDRTFRIGSDDGFDDVCFHYRVNGEEMIAPGIIEVAFQDAERGFLLTRTDPTSPNLVAVDGLPLRALPLEPEKAYAITFGALNYSEDDRHVLYLMIRGNRPIFWYRDTTFTEGFSREVLGGLITLPHRPNRARHLAVGDRIRFAGLGRSKNELLGQSSILRHGGRYWLAANDADLLLNGRPFPDRVLVKPGAAIRLTTTEFGEARKSVSFRIHAPSGPNNEVAVQLLDSDKKSMLLDPGKARRICLTADESFYSDTYDIRDPQFPRGGLVLDREGGQYIFRGRFLSKNTIYQAGKTVFSIDEIKKKNLMAIAWFGVLFLAAVFFVPPALIRKDPLIGVVLSAALFLLAFRQLLAFRAWTGPPFKLSVLNDSLTAPYLFFLIVLVVSTRYRIFTILKRCAIQARNFFWVKNRIVAPRLDQAGSGLHILLITAYGLLIYLFFQKQIEPLFPILILLCLPVSLLFNSLDTVERRVAYYSSVGASGVRWRPIIWLAPLFVGLILIAPLLGGREVIAILPGRPRPDILIQLFLLFLVAHFAAVWIKESSHHVPNPIFILLSLLLAVVLPFAQGALSRDMGFFVMVGLPSLVVLICATWKLDHRIRFVLVLGFLMVLAGPLLLKTSFVSLESEPMRRIAFFIDKDRIKSEYFFTYLAHLPMLWSSAQGLFGGGFFKGDWYPEIGETSVNDNVASVFIQGELGAAGTILTLGVFVLITVAGVLFVSEHRARRSGYRLWFLFAISLTMIWTAATMFLANLGYFPLTGKNLPFLGLDSLNDIIRYGLLTGFMVRYMVALKEEEPWL